MLKLLVCAVIMHNGRLGSSDGFAGRCVVVSCSVMFRGVEASSILVPGRWILFTQSLTSWYLQWLCALPEQLLTARQIVWHYLVAGHGNLLELERLYRSVALHDVFYSPSY